MKKIILFYEFIAREYKSLVNIKKEMKKLENCEVRIYSILFQYKDALSFAKKGIDMVIMPWVYDKVSYEYLLPFYRINHNLILINLHNEQIGSVETDPIIFPKDNYAKNTVLHFCWGDSFKKGLLKREVKEENIFITGNARLDSIFDNLKTKISLSKEFNIDESKKWVLFAESRDWVYDKFNYDLKLNHCEKNLVELSYNFSKKSLNNFLEDLEKLPDSFFEKYVLIYRPHPGCVMPRQINPRVKVINNYSIYDWLKNIDIYLTSSSTSMFEAEAMGKACILCVDKDFPKDVIAHGLDEYYQIDSILNLSDKTIEESKKFNNKSIYKKYIGENDHKNAYRIAETALKQFEIRKGKSMMIDVPFNKKRIRKSIIYTSVSKVLGFFNVINILKWPKTAYLMRYNNPFIVKNRKDFNIERY